MEVSSKPSDISMQEAVSRQAEAAQAVDFNFERELPANLERLKDISENFYWSWRPDGTDLFRDISPELWVTCEQNPKLFLSLVDPLLLAQKSADPAYVDRLKTFASEYDNYLAESPATFGIVSPATPAAYFCA